MERELEQLETLIAKLDGRYKLAVLCQKRLQEYVQFAKLGGQRLEGQMVQKVLGEVEQERIGFQLPGPEEASEEREKLEFLPLDDGSGE